jgi:hypothetical protein
MMLNFEESEPSERSFELIRDCFVSMLRQWFLRTRSWKLIPAILFALLQVEAFALWWHLPMHLPHPAIWTIDSPEGMELLVVSAGAITVLVATLTAVCVRNFAGRRVGGSRARRSTF